jgi:hypothetical protein
MSAHFRSCTSEEDYVQFTLFFIRNRLDFNRRFSLNDALFNVLETIHDSKIILVVDELDQVVGWGHYQYVTTEHEPDPQGEIVFIHSVILIPEYRSSRVFFTGFRYLVNQIIGENPQVKQVQFFAQMENVYLNRLYAKFARIIGQRDGYHGRENVYATEIGPLSAYLSTGRSTI